MSSDRPSRPPPTFVEPPRTKSGEIKAVQAYRSKLESIAEGTYSTSVSLTDKIGDFLDALRATNPPPRATGAPVELPPSEDDIIGWDDERDVPIRRRDLRLRATPAREFVPYGTVAATVDPMNDKNPTQTTTEKTTTEHSVEKPAAPEPAAKPATTEKSVEVKK